MKRVIALLMIFMLVMICGSSLAAGKISVIQENFHVIDTYRLYGYVYAKVTNVGDKPIVVNTSLLEIFDINGDPLTSTDYFYAYAKYIQPDEIAYIKMSDEVEDAEPNDVDDYMLTVTGKSNNTYVSHRLPCTTSYEPNVKDGYYTYNYMYATFTNDTSEPIYDISIVMVLLDAEGNILYMTDSSMSDKALMPGSSVTVRKRVDSDFVEYYQKNGLTPACVDAIAYVNIEKGI